MPVGLLGTLEVVGDDGRPVEIGGAQPRVVLALLVAEAGRVVATDTLLDAVWGDEPPASAVGTLQTYVSRLRRVLGAVGATIEREPAGYRLVIEPEELDVHRFEVLADEGRAALDAGDPERARSILVEAAAMWRGPALLEVRDRMQASGLARRLVERRLAVIEDRLTAELAMGRHAAIVGELAQLVTDHPLREGFWALLATARYRAGQQADALRAIADARHTLVEELGVEPGPRLREIEAAILAQDQALDATPRVTPAPAAEPVPPSAPVVPPVPDTADQDPMVGRGDELEALHQALAEALGGSACVAVVQGEAGVGKTRLVEELAAEAAGRGARVVWGRSLEGDAAPAYWPWLGALRPLRAGRTDGADASVDQLLDATGALPAAPAADRPLLLDGVLQLLVPDAQAEPVVAVLEDVQWAGSESLELLAQVVAGLDRGRLLLVLTFREGEDASQPLLVAALAAASRRPGTRRIRLRGLAAADTAALLAQVHGGSVDGEVARVVHERADGNPFYAIELVRLLASEGMVHDADLARSAVPLGVRDVVRQRLAALPPETVELLQLAAAAGRDLDVELLSRASGRSIGLCLDDLEVALRHQLLVESGDRVGPRFSHALVREVVVGDLSALRRARTHLLVADAIEASGRGDDEAEILAEHLWAAAPIGVGRRAADALDRAAEVAIRRFAVRAAVDLLERSLQLRRAAGGDDEAATAELGTLSALVWALRAQQGYQGGMAHYARGADLARRLGRADVELEMLWAEWAAHETACDFEQARPAAERFRARAEESDDPLVQMTGYATWAIQCWHDGDLRSSHESFGRAHDAKTALARRPDELSLAGAVHALTTGFRLYMAEQVGELDDPDAAFAAAAADATSDFRRAMTLGFACASATSAGALARVERCGRAALEAEGAESLGFWGSQARMYLGAALMGSGRLEEGRPLFETGHAAYRAAGARLGTALMLAAAASAEAVAGDLARAKEHLQLARDEADLGERYALPAVLLASADVDEAAGAPAGQVRRQREEAEAVARDQGAVVLAGRARAALDGDRWSGAVAQPSAGAGPSTSSPSTA